MLATCDRKNRGKREIDESLIATPTPCPVAGRGFLSLSFSLLPPFPPFRLCFSRQLYVTGGFNADGTAGLATMERYDRAKRRWLPCTAMPAARHHHDCAVIGGEMYLTGGSGVQSTMVGSFAVLTARSFP